jgi:hypothetical protein
MERIVEMQIVRGRGRPKLNPEGICNCCKIEIKDKQRSSLYCKNCARFIADLQRRLISRYRNKYRK